MLNPISVHEVAKARQRDFMQEAKGRRLASQLKAAQPDRPSLSGRLADEVGSLLIEAGERLKERHVSPEGRALG